MRTSIVVMSLLFSGLLVITPSVSTFSQISMGQFHDTSMVNHANQQVSTLINRNYNLYWDGNVNPTKQLASQDHMNSIDEFTWSIIRYDHVIRSDHFGSIYTPKPSQGSILIPGNMMSVPVCKAALEVYRDTKWDTLLALEEFDVNTMIHTDTAFIDGGNEWNIPEEKYTFRKESAEEMRILGEICFKANLVGDCYAQASFNTAVLRLCGFSPEEVFTITVLGHAINIVKINDTWYAFDSVYAYWVKKGYSERLIFDFYDPPRENHIMWLENDKYFINFGIPGPYYNKPYSNIDPVVLRDIVEEIVPLLNNSVLGYPGIDVDAFIEDSTPCPDMVNVSIPYTVLDSIGGNLHEKAIFLANLNKEFILIHVGGVVLNQYDRSLYTVGLLTVQYPQAYANAAKYAVWTSFFAGQLDSSFPLFDLMKTSLWIRCMVQSKQVMPRGCVAFSDLLYLRHSGSTIDQSLLAYGTLRNMDNNDDLWDLDDLYVLVTKDFQGYLAVNLSYQWLYLNFDRGTMIHGDPPENLLMSFNEVDCILPSNNHCHIREKNTI